MTQLQAPPTAAPSPDAACGPSHPVAGHPPEISLDPQDWLALRGLAHQMVEEMMSLHEDVAEGPAWRPIPEEVEAHFREPLPRTGQGAAKVYEEFVERVLPYPYGNIHPRFWGFVCGTGTPLGMLAEMLAAAMNPNVYGFHHGAVRVEEQVIEWCKEMLGYPAEASGLLVTGGSMANVLGLAVGRHARAGFDIRDEGLQGDHPRLMVYASRETHSSVRKAVELLGLGFRSLRLVPTTDDFRVDLDVLAERIAADRRAGHRPVIVVGNAGTVNTGAVDDLPALADLCRAEGLWFHVDGAFGALAAVSPKLRPLVRGLERADSLAFDLHKWMYMPYDVGCVLVRDAEVHRGAFAVVPPYLEPLDGGLTGKGTVFGDLGIELSRQFRALKVWMSIKAEGIERFGRLIEQNVEQARYLAAKVESHPFFELVAPVPLNVVAFRFFDPALTAAELDLVNCKLLVALQERGIAVPSATRIRDRFALRCAVTNHRSRRGDFDVLIREAFHIARELLRDLPDRIEEAPVAE